MEVANEVASFVDTWGWLGVLILVVIGGHFRLYVFRWQWDEKSRECESWRATALSKDEKLDTSLLALGKAVDMVEATQSQTRARGAPRR